MKHKRLWRMTKLNRLANFSSKKGKTEQNKAKQKKGKEKHLSSRVTIGRGLPRGKPLILYEFITLWGFSLDSYFRKLKRHTVRYPVPLETKLADHIRWNC